MPDIVTTLITAGAALLGAFVGSIGRPIAEDKARQWAEQREGARQATAERVRRVERVSDLLVAASGEGPFEPASRTKARAELITAAYATGDAELVAECDGFLGAQGPERAAHLTAARRICGQLLAPR